MKSQKNSSLSLASLLVSMQRRVEPCVICLDGMDDPTATIFYRCAHQFHSDCAAKIRKNVCPICRFPIRNDDDEEEEEKEDDDDDDDENDDEDEDYDDEEDEDYGPDALPLVIDLTHLSDGEEQQEESHSRALHEIIDLKIDTAQHDDEDSFIDHDSHSDSDEEWLPPTMKRRRMGLKVK